MAAFSVLLSGLLICPLPAAADTPLFNPVLLYAQVLQHINPKLAIAQARDFALEVLRDAQKTHLDPRLLVAIVTVESHWNTKALSPVGAEGLGQLMPGTAAGLGVDPFSPHQNLAGTSTYLSRMIQRFGSKPRGLSMAIGAYNAGPEAVSKYGGIPPYQETQQYVKRVLHVMNQLKHRVPAAVLSAGELDTADSYWTSPSASPTAPLPDSDVPASTPAAPPADPGAASPASVPASTPAADASAPGSSTNADAGAPPDAGATR